MRLGLRVKSLLPSPELRAPVPVDPASNMTVRFHGDPPTHVTFGSLELLGLPHASTTRHCPDIAPPADPVMPFGPEAQALFHQQGLDLSRTVYLRQVHGKVVQKVEGGSEGFAGQGDVLLTSTPGLPLSIFTADCLAIILLDPVAPRLALAHVGWRGTVEGAAVAAVQAMAREGTKPEEIWAAISPSIGPCCYEVDHLVIDPLRQAYPAHWRRWARPRESRKWMLDLWTANYDQLLSAGCRAEQILNVRLCTACSTDRFFSYRREGSCGRQVTVAALSNAQIAS